jgi:signal transduction histidine kinase
VEPSASPAAPEDDGLEYISILSHVLMTPLSGIVLWCDMLRGKQEVPELVARGLVAIDRSARAQVAILDNLVELGRLQARSTELHRSRVDLLACVRDVLARNASAAEQHKVTLRFEPPAREHVVDGDPVRLRTALHNVVANAVKASPCGGRIDVVLEKSADGLLILVSDEGSGIAPEALSNLFEIHALNDAEVARRRGALGLGLPITRWILQLHGGNLLVTAREPQGCCCTLRLPGP